MSFSVAHRAQKIYSTVLEIFDYKKSSDVVTPYDVVKQQVKGVSSNDTVCIPGAGIGTYVVALIEQGVKPENIYAVELDETYYELGSAMLERLGVNYVHTDFLDWNPDMKFDVIIGNPPYQRSREVRNVGSPLWPEFIEKSLNNVKNGGIVSLVVPFTWMQKNARSKAWRSIMKNDLVKLIPSVDYAFPGVDTGGITVITLRKQSYSGSTELPDGSLIDIRMRTPSNNKEWNKAVFEFLRNHETLDLEVKTGPINPSINSSHWSLEKTDTHCYEVFYSSAKNRRVMWCDQPIGDHGKLKLAVATYGDMYGTLKITEAGCGRQVQYVLGTQEELEDLKEKLLSEKSRKMNSLMAYGAYHLPLCNVVR